MGLCAKPPQHVARKALCSKAETGWSSGIPGLIESVNRSTLLRLLAYGKTHLWRELQKCLLLFHNSSLGGWGGQMSQEQDTQTAAFPRKHAADSQSLSKVAARVKTVMTHGAGFASYLKIAEGLVNHRKARRGAVPPLSRSLLR